jgi:hypothetical protein
MRPSFSRTKWLLSGLFGFAVAAMLHFGAASAYAKERSVAMTFSGNGASASPINLQYPNSTTIEENVAGDGTLGAFTLRNITADANSPAPDPPSTCSGGSLLFFPRPAGAAILRFEDRSLLNLTLTSGGDCIDLAAGVGHCTLHFQVTGGTGRFKNASGALTYTETALPVLFDDVGNPVFFDESGELKGTVSGVDIGDEGHDDGRQ